NKALGSRPCGYGSLRSQGRRKEFSEAPHPLAGSKRPWDRSAAFAVANEEKPMRRTVIRYKAKPDMADRNAELVAAVFAELKAAQPEGLRYMSLRLEDDTFIHFVETAADDGSSPLPKLPAFAAFQNGIR